jgi:alkylation response protein AidB-like acyl-CoA dehydrogenase
MNEHSEQSHLASFRQEVRQWLEANCPNEMRGAMASDADVCWGGRGWVFESEPQKLWFERMVAKGYTAPDWPVEYGGAGMTIDEATVFREELAAINARPALYGMGVAMVGPAILKFGTEEQKREHLTKIARGEIRWCQGYSEPGAGSDLASLQTKAVLEGDSYRVSGQKVWTSHAHHSDWIFCLVRTDNTGPKHHGITFLLIDMASPGIEARPIVLISGKSQFCETFFDGVLVPRRNVLGEVDKGWGVAKYLLLHERQMVGGAAFSRGAFANRSLGETVADFRAGEVDPVLRSRIAEVEIDTEAVRATIARYQEETAGGIEFGARASVLKFAGVRARKQQFDLLMQAQGSEALEVDPEAEGDSAAEQWLRSRGNSIEGGSNEIMLNIISKTLLGLPQS